MPTTPRVLDVRSAASAGIGPRRLRGRSFTRVTNGAYLDVDESSRLHPRCLALLSVLPGCVLSHWTATALHGLPLPPGRSAEPFHVLVAPGRRACRRAGVVAHTTQHPVHPVSVRGLPVSDLVRTWCDLARSGAGISDLVVVGDAVERRFPGAVLPLRRAVEAGARRRGAGNARRALDLIDGRAESPMESLLRVAVAQAGLPPPVPQLVIRDDRGGFVARVDLAWPDSRLVVEYDGGHHMQRRQWVADLRRRERLEAMGWTVLVLTAEDVLGDGRTMIARIAARLLG